MFSPVNELGAWNRVMRAWSRSLSLQSLMLPRCAVWDLHWSRFFPFHILERMLNASGPESLIVAVGPCP